jgi:hypothetical protein
MSGFFDKRYFKKSIQSQLEKYEDLQDFHELKNIRIEMYKRDVGDGIETYLRHLRLFSDKMVSANFERRCFLFDFSNDLSISEISLVKKIAMKSSRVNIFVLLYSDIETWIKNYIKLNNIKSGGNMNSFYFNNVYDNRLIVTTMNLNDEIWNLGIQLFREMYSYVFRTNDVRGIDYLDQFPEIKRTLLNLIKCSSLKRINNMFLQNVKSQTRRKTRDSLDYRKIFNDFIKTDIMENDDKFLVLFDISSNDDIEKVESFVDKCLYP